MGDGFHSRLKLGERARTEKAWGQTDNPQLRPVSRVHSAQQISNSVLEVKVGPSARIMTSALL